MGIRPLRRDVWLPLPLVRIHTHPKTHTKPQGSFPIPCMWVSDGGANSRIRKGEKTRSGNRNNFEYVGESRKFLTFGKRVFFFLPPSAPVYNGHKTSIRLFKLWSSVPPVYGKRREMDVCASQFQFWGGEEEKREIDGFVYFLSERDGPLLSYTVLL